MSENNLQLFGKFRKGEKLFFFHLRLAIRSPNYGVDNAIILGCYQAQRNRNGIVCSISLIK
jgi:hypothetical protein